MTLKGLIDRIGCFKTMHEFLTLRTYLVYNAVVRLCQFLVVAGNSSQNENRFLQNNLIG